MRTINYEAEVKKLQSNSTLDPERSVAENPK